MSQDSHREMSPTGQALFDMLKGMSGAQARVYQNGGSITEANRAARIAAAQHKPLVIESFNPSKK